MTDEAKDKAVAYHKCDIIHTLALEFMAKRPGLTLGKAMVLIIEKKDVKP